MQHVTPQKISLKASSYIPEAKAKNLYDICGLFFDPFAFFISGIQKDTGR